jgi:hypothetical protein
MDENRALRIQVVGIDESDDCSEAYDVSVHVFEHGQLVESGVATVSYDAGLARWVREDSASWLSAGLMRFVLTSELAMETVCEAIESGAAEAADKHDAKRGCRLLERALEMASLNETDRLEELRDRENDRRIDMAREDAECDRRGMSRG